MKPPKHRNTYPVNKNNRAGNKWIPGKSETSMEMPIVSLMPKIIDPVEEEPEMPYINKKARGHYDEHINALCKELHESEWNPGHINYIFSKIFKRMWILRPGYTTINDVKGILSCVGVEFDRRNSTPYEKKKIEENGDI